MSATAKGTFVDPDFVRIANRSQGGAAGEHVVSIFRLEDGQHIAVSRGFVPTNVENLELQTVPDGETEVSGWLRKTVTKEGFGATDLGEGTILPRLETDKVASRFGEPLGNYWLQLNETPTGAQTSKETSVDGPPTSQGSNSITPNSSASSVASSLNGASQQPNFPELVPLPPLDSGPHFSYAIQWFTFALLGIGFYVAIVRRKASERS